MAFSVDVTLTKRLVRREVTPEELEAYHQRVRRDNPKGLLPDGRHYTEAVPELKKLRRETKSSSAIRYEALLWKCIRAAEREAIADRSFPPPAYTRMLAILYEKQKRFQEAIDAIDRWNERPGTTNQFDQRRARLAWKLAGKPERLPAPSV